MCNFQVTEPSSTSLGSSSSCSISPCVAQAATSLKWTEMMFMQFVSKPLHHRICSVHLHQIHLNLQTPVHQQKSCTTAAGRRRPRFGTDINMKGVRFSNSRLKPSSLRVLFKPLWIDASGVLPSFQSCFSASFTSSFLTAVALKKTYEYLLVPFQGANSADFQFINSKLLLHSVTSIDWRFLEFCFNETVQFCMAFHVEIHFFQGNPTPITYSNSPCLHQAFAALRSAAFRAVSSANRWVALGNDSNNWAKLPQRESAK